MRVDLRLLGYPRLEIDGREVDFRLQKGLALIAFVAEARAPIARDAVSALLWPDLDEDAARARLRRTLHRIRQAFGAEFIAADRISLRFDPAVRFSMDAAAFEAACDEDRFADAVQLYHRDFLSGLSLAGCQEFEEWAFFRREALRSRLVQALERLVERGLAAGDARAALSSAIRLVGLDPFSEAAHRHVIRAHLMAGDRSAAERQYEACRKLLAEELGVSVDFETTALLAASGAGAAAAPAQTRYAAHNGIHLAYQTAGKGPFDIVFVPGFVSHVERVWDEPRCRQFLTKLSEFGRTRLFRPAWRRPLGSNWRSTDRRGDSRGYSDRS